MDEPEILAGHFEAHRGHLRSVAYRMLGSLSEADDAVQETWLRLGRADTGEVTNLRGWLTTVVARICLDMLRARRSRREQPLAVSGPEPMGERTATDDPEHAALLADAVGVALLVVLDTLAPAERLAFVLHDLFDLPFDEIAPIVGRSPAATRQLASRARRRVQGASPGAATPVDHQRAVVDAFLAAARDGDIAGLLAVLAPDVVLRADPAAVEAGAEAEVRGAATVAATFAGRARAAQSAVVDGAPGLVWTPGGEPRVVFTFEVARGRIVAITMHADPDRLRRFDVVLAGA
jgi:RNA polymerase sigma-70 factor (ECF subfamily)